MIKVFESENKEDNIKINKILDVIDKYLWEKKKETNGMSYTVPVKTGDIPIIAIAMDLLDLFKKEFKNGNN
jgi:hypothetical protein